jgi:TonB family protein
MFVEGTPEEVRREMQRLEQGASILDDVRDQLKSLGGILGVADRDRIELLTTSVREAEVQLEQQKEEPKNEERPQDEPPPPSDTEEQVQNLSQAAAAQDAAPAMANLSLSDLSSALGGASGDSMGASSAGLGGVGFAGGTGTGGAGLGGGGGMVSSADLDNKPTVTTRVNPKPVKGVAGKVKLLLVVGSDGSVAEVKTLESDHPDLLRNCVSAVRQWRFKPGMRDGRPVPFKMHQPFSFQG